MLMNFADLEQFLTATGSDLTRHFINVVVKTEYDNMIAANYNPATAAAMLATKYRRPRGHVYRITDYP